MTQEIQLRPYQQKALDAVKAAFKGEQHEDVIYRDGHSGPARTVVLVMPCRSGKTYTFSAIAKGAAAKGNNVNIMAHRKELIFQASKSLASLGVFHDLVAPRNKRSALIREHNEKFLRPFIRTGANVAMSSIQTLTRRLEWLDQFRPALHIPDECHRSLSISYTRVFEASPYARILGVTATPCRTDNRGLGDIYQAMVIGPSHAELQELGNLLPARVFAPPNSVDFTSVGKKDGDLDADQLAALMDRPEVTGDAVKHYLELAPHRPGIAYCCNRKHARHVAEQFQEAGVKAFVIDGTMDDKERDRLIYGQADGSVELLVSVDLISEGTDLICAEVAILLRKTDSLSLYIQQTNRVLTPGDGKEYGLILDHVDNARKHGMPDEYREWSLDGEDVKKRQSSSEDGPTIEQCPECYHVHMKEPTCPNCGYEYKVKSWKPPEQSDDNLVEITGKDDDPDRQRRQEKRKEMARRAVQEKIALQKHVGDLLAEYVTNVGTEADAGVNQAEIRKMTPKPLRETRDRLKREIEEADSLRIELGTVCRKYVGSGGSDADIGFAAVDIETMKADRLRDEIDRVGGMMWEVKSA